jgi:glutamate-5-semialdehyde dehydrogenase
VSTREDVSALLKLDQYIDLVIPRGSNALVRNVMDNTRIPVMGHADGICSIYVDADADLEKAVKLVVDSKTQYVAACNTAETLLIHESAVETMLPVIGQALVDAKVKLHAEERLLPHLPQGDGSVVAATEKDFTTEYLALEMAVKAVPSVEAAIEHINTRGSHHTDCIVTENGETAEQFLEGVASAGVYHNASTRFADGFRYGFGAEVGVSTNRIHARGPVGLEGLLTYKYRMHGNGHCVGDYGQGKKQYTHITRKLVGDNPRAPNLAAAKTKAREEQLLRVGLCVAGLASAAFILLRAIKSSDA